MCCAFQRGVSIVDKNVDAALTALQCDMSAEIDSYRRKRDLIYQGLKDSFDLEEL